MSSSDYNVDLQLNCFIIGENGFPYSNVIRMYSKHILNEHDIHRCKTNTKYKSLNTVITFLMYNKYKP